MANTYEITKVSVGYSDDGGRHDHITQVELNNSVDQRFTRETIAADLRSPFGDRYYTFAQGTRAEVILDACPHCGRRDYITTTPDWTTANNLLSLPRF